MANIPLRLFGRKTDRVQRKDSEERDRKKFWSCVLLWFEPPSMKRRKESLGKEETEGAKEREKLSAVFVTFRQYAAGRCNGYVGENGERAFSRACYFVVSCCWKMEQVTKKERDRAEKER
jgi:hypothetical protein